MGKLAGRWEVGTGCAIKPLSVKACYVYERGRNGQHGTVAQSRGRHEPHRQSHFDQPGPESRVEDDGTVSGSGEPAAGWNRSRAVPRRLQRLRADLQPGRAVYL